MKEKNKRNGLRLPMNRGISAWNRGHFINRLARQENLWILGLWMLVPLKKMFEEFLE